MNTDWLRMIYYLPVATAFLFAIAAAAGRWRRTLCLILSTLVSIIVAHQHQAFLASIVISLLNPEWLPEITKAITVAASTAILFVLFWLVYPFMWQPNNNGFQSGIWLRFLFGAGMGLLLGAVLLPGVVAVVVPNALKNDDGMAVLVNQTLSVVVQLCDFWIPGVTPS